MNVEASVSVLQGAREARGVIWNLCTASAAPEALHAALQDIRATGDGARLRGFTAELQKALQDGQRRAPDLRDLKLFHDLRARLAIHGLLAYRSDPADGGVVYVTLMHGVPRLYPDLAALRTRVQDLEAYASR